MLNSNYFFAKSMHCPTPPRNPKGLPSGVSAALTLWQHTFSNLPGLDNLFGCFRLGRLYGLSPLSLLLLNDPSFVEPPNTLSSNPPKILIHHFYESDKTTNIQEIIVFS